MNKKQIPHIIGGKKVFSERTSSVYNPANGEVQAEVCLAGKKEVDQAVETAYEAFKEWRLVTPIKRSRILFVLKQLVEENIDEFARIISSEHGKTLDDAKGSVSRGLEVIEFACGFPQLGKGEYSANVGSGVDAYTMRQPLGVCVGITPFNFPAMVPLWMLPVALACGNSFILKISEKVPSVANFLAELVAQAGAPAGVFNVVHGDKECVDVLIRHPLVQAISFVGSTGVAKSIYETAAQHGKRVQALGGAKNHLVVMPDADIEQVVPHISGAAFGSAGERCMAVSAVICIGDDVGDKLISSLTEKMGNLKIGAGNVAGVDMGPLITREHLQKVTSFLEIGVREGARLVIDGRERVAAEKERLAAGFFLGPSLFDHVQPTMRVYQEEIFGPVLSVLRVDELSKAMEWINAHRYGNGVSIFTNRGDVARFFVEHIQVGMVGVNVPIPVPVAYHSFGGWKQSIFGDMHMHGMEGIRFYSKAKAVTCRWQSDNFSDSKLAYKMPLFS